MAPRFLVNFETENIAHRTSRFWEKYWHIILLCILIIILCLCSVLLIIMLHDIKATPGNQESSSENVLEICDSITKYKPSDHTVAEAGPFHKTGKKNFYLNNMFKTTWYQAMQYCLSKGMRLASIESKEENDKVKMDIVNTGDGQDHFWTSGTDLADEGIFVWMANGRPFTFTDWGAPEPNNLEIGGENEHCVEIAEGRWNDIRCSTRLYFICEDIIN